MRRSAFEPKEAPEDQARATHVGAGHVGALGRSFFCLGAFLFVSTGKMGGVALHAYMAETRNRGELMVYSAVVCVGSVVLNVFLLGVHGESARNNIKNGGC